MKEDNEYQQWEEEIDGLGEYLGDGVYINRWGNIVEGEDLV